MKQKPFLMIILSVLVALSLVVTYFILNIGQFDRWIRPGNQPTQEVTVTNPQSLINDYYDTTQVTIDQVVIPDEAVVVSQGQYYLAIDAEKIREMFELTKETPVQVNRLDQIKNRTNQDQFLSMESLQFTFPTQIPLVSLRAYVDMPDDSDERIMVDQLVFSMSGDRAVYFLDTRQASYIKGSLDRNFDLESLTHLMNINHNYWVAADRYQLKERSVYLPQQSRKMQSQIYTLETLADTLFVNKLYPNADFEISENQATNSRVYQNYRYTTEFNTQSQIMDLVISSLQRDLTSQASPAEQLASAFQYIANYEYWHGDIRFYQRHERDLIFRRYLKGLPIFTVSNLPNYGASRVVLSGSSQAEVSRFVLPLLILQAHVDDLGEWQTIESGVWLTQRLAEYDIPLSQLDDIALAYQWQDDMENFQKVVFVPTWYVQVGSTYYSIDQLETGEIHEAIYSQEAN